MFSLRLIPDSIVHEGDERFPVVVHLNAAQLQQGLRAFFDPAHPATVEALGNHVAHQYRPRFLLSVGSNKQWLRQT